MASYRAEYLAEILNAQYQGDANCEVNSLASITNAKSGQLTFLDNDKLASYLKTTDASVVILAAKNLSNCPTNAIIVDKPHVAFAKIATLFTEKFEQTSGVHPTAVIGESCEIHPSASIGANTVIGNNVVIAESAIISPNCTVGNDCHIGVQTVLRSQAVLYARVVLGERCVIHSGAVIGSDGFGYANDQGQWVKVPQIGTVIVGDDVEVGANTTIDCGAIENTIIGNGVKIDNQVQIAHNVIIGDHTAIAGCTGIAGSAKIGKHCMIAGDVQINGHISIADKTIITATSSVGKSIDESGETWSSGLPALPHKKWLKNTIAMVHIAELAKKFKKYDKMIQQELTK